ncbi:MAG: DUF4105 domain-containing protein [Pseudohongiellaceae bacterium]
MNYSIPIIAVFRELTPLPTFRTLILALTLAGLCHNALALEAINPDDEVDLPRDLSQVHFYLLTIDVGDRIWDNFGHTALRVVDENSNTDMVFNWGLFDTSVGLVRFSTDFFLGIMNYQLGTSSPEAELNLYRQQQRSVWQDRINLNNAQKERLYRRLLWNLQTENRVYSYEYFDDNCTTRVRDYLDEALMGKIQGHATDMTNWTYRDAVVDHYRSLAPIAMSLDILMNSGIDRYMTEWEAMFLPLVLRRELMEIPSDVAVDGERRMLLSPGEMLLTFPAPATQPNAYYFAAGALWLPVILLFPLVRRVPIASLSAQSRYTLRSPRFSFRVMGMAGLITSLFSGTYGLMMLGGWFFSGHNDLYHNVNLLLFWPTDVLGVVVSLRWLVMAKPWPMSHNTAPFINWYLLAHVLGMVIYAVVAIFGLAAQALLNPLLFIVPGFFLYTVLIWMTGFQLGRTRAMFA